MFLVLSLSKDAGVSMFLILSLSKDAGTHMWSRNIPLPEAHASFLDRLGMRASFYVPHPEPVEG